MNKYEKPIVLANNELFEGVYAASGTAAGGGANQPRPYSYSLTGEWTGTKQYSIDFTNLSSEDVSSVTVTIPAYGDITSVSGNASGVVGTDSVTLTFSNYGNTIGANATVNCNCVQISGTGDFGLK